MLTGECSLMVTVRREEALRGVFLLMTSVMRTNHHTHTKKKRRAALVNLLAETFKHARSSPTPSSPNSKAEKEVQRYQDSPPLPLTDELLGWWKSEACKYPHLAKMAQRYLCVPGTSAPSERIFSGDIISDQKCALTYEHDDQLLFFKKYTF